jgi:hypothetical protein
MVVRSPNRAGYQSIGLALGLRASKKAVVRTQEEDWQEKYDQEETSRR